ncbi:MAG: hypothetical protein ACM3NO_00365 [Deltaproteobacteria bacterium]
MKVVMSSPDITTRDAELRCAPTRGINRWGRATHRLKTGKPLETLCLLVCFAIIAVGQSEMRPQVEGALDSWTSLASTRDAILKITPDPVPTLIGIAKSNPKGISKFLRGRHAIALLATFKSEPSEIGLAEIAKDGVPQFRCFALQALGGMKSRNAIAVLIGSLDDHDVCMHTVVTDPAREHDVYVSDEAVRILELVTGQSFGEKQVNGHRATKPWKDWWAKQRGSK